MSKTYIIGILKKENNRYLTIQFRTLPEVKETWLYKWKKTLNLKEKKKLRHFTSEINKRKRNLPTTVGGNVNWYSHYEEKYGDSLKKLGLNIPYDPATPLLGIFPDKTVLKGICTAVFIAALFTIARTWKQPRCPLTDEWIKKMWYVYTME